MKKRTLKKVIILAIAFMSLGSSVAFGCGESSDAAITGTKTVVTTPVPGTTTTTQSGTTK